MSSKEKTNPKTCYFNCFKLKIHLKMCVLNFFSIEKSFFLFDSFNIESDANRDIFLVFVISLKSFAVHKFGYMSQSTIQQGRDCARASRAVLARCSVRSPALHSSPRAQASAITLSAWSASSKRTVLVARRQRFPNFVMAWHIRTENVYELEAKLKVYIFSCGFWRLWNIRYRKNCNYIYIHLTFNISIIWFFKKNYFQYLHAWSFLHVT